MTARVHNITFDCADPYRLVGFWSQVTGFQGDPEDPNLPEDQEAILLGPDGHPNLLFIRVPEGKTVKNRLHLDVSPIDGSTEDEVTRLLGLGATKTDVGQGSDRNWVVMADPEGNEFCVLRTLAPQN